MNYILTKTKYLSGLQCPKRLWLEVHDPDKATPPSLHLQHLFDLGHEVNSHSRNFYPNGVLIDAIYPDEVVIKTNEVIEQGRTTIFEGGFLFDEIFVRVDILNKDDIGLWNLIEVKQSTKLKDEHIPDVAVQKYVLEGAGYRITNSILMHINNQCTFPDLSNLFVQEDISSQVEEFIPEVISGILKQKDLLSEYSEPQIHVGDHCKNPFECPFNEYCWKYIPRKSIFTIPRLSENKEDQLFQQGILAIEDLPEDFPLTDNQQKYVGLIKTGKPVIDIEGIKQELSGLIFPLYFLDFETYSTPIPKFNGLHPFSKLPFQYSCHVLGENGKLNHYEYLHQSKNDPRPTLIESLINDIGNQGSVVVYNVNFERNILKDLAIQFPQYSDKLLNIEVRLWDQLNIFKNHYSHPGFLSSNSIKDIIPVIQPSLSYKSLNLQSGEDAGVLWLQMLNLEEGEEKDKLIYNLREYCKLDTLAMVEIHRHLIQLY